MGVSVEMARYKGRIDRLRDAGARIKFLSLEPLLGPLPGLDLSGIDWVIVGGESGPNKKRAGRILEGRVWDEMPDAVTTFDSKSPTT